MMWWLLACFSEVVPDYEVSTIRQTVEFVGEPRLEMENGEVFVLEDAFCRIVFSDSILVRILLDTDMSFQYLQPLRVIRY